MVEIYCNSLDGKVVNVIDKIGENMNNINQMDQAETNLTIAELKQQLEDEKEKKIKIHNDSENEFTNMKNATY